VPFRGLLGETYELQIGDFDFKAEQVSYKPQITVWSCMHRTLNIKVWSQFEVSTKYRIN